MQLLHFNKSQIILFSRRIAVPRKPCTGWVFSPSSFPISAWVFVWRIPGWWPLSLHKIYGVGHQSLKSLEAFHPISFYGGIYVVLQRDVLNCPKTADLPNYPKKYLESKHKKKRTELMKTQGHAADRREGCFATRLPGNKLFFQVLLNISNPTGF